MASFAVDSADSVHLQIEATKLAFADAQACVSDIEHMTATTREPSRQGVPAPARDVDRSESGQAGVRLGHCAGERCISPQPMPRGVMVSMIQSNYMGFGSGVVVPGTGISLQNRGADFTVAQGHPNRVGPSKPHITPSSRVS